MADFRTRLKKFLGGVSGQEDASSAEKKVREDLRNHLRYRLDSDRRPIDLALIAPGSSAFKIKSISYGGLAITAEGIDWPHQESRHLTLHVYGLTCPIHVKKVHHTSDVIGLQILHEDAKVLVFLRPVLEYMRQGASLAPIDRSLLKEGTRQDAAYFRGEGPIDIVAHSDSIQMIFRDHDQYSSVHLKGSVLQTLITLDKAGAAARMAPTGQLDLEILRKAAYIALGAIQGAMPQHLPEIERALTPFLDAILQALHQGTPSMVAS